MTHLGSIKPLAILKNTAAYLIFRYATDTGSYVCKIANRDNDKLAREVGRIIMLRDRYPALASRLPKIINTGVIRHGIHSGKRYYIQNFFEGTTFSHLVQGPETSSEWLSDIFHGTVKLLVDFIFEHDFSDAYSGHSGDFLRDAIYEERDAIRSLKNVAFIAGSDSIIINGRELPGLDTLLGTIFDERTVAALNAEPSFISELGHWNFHGDNIIVGDDGLSDLHIIDPDAGIDTCDPMFGLARFLYTFPHDSADYEKYLIQSQVFSLMDGGEQRFDIKLLWSPTAHDAYAKLFGAFPRLPADSLVAIDRRFGEGMAATRLKLCFLFCLLRGVRANYSEQIEFENSELTEFRNKAVFLLLQAIQFANELTEAKDGDVT